jgi:hypothetical protein
MKVLILTNGELVEKEINGTLDELQEIVEGYIEIPFISDTFSDNNIDVIINEEGKFIDGMNREIAIIQNSQILDIVYGNCIFASHDEEGETIGLNEEQIRVVTEELETIVELMNKNTLEDFDVRVLFI